MTSIYGVRSAKKKRVKIRSIVIHLTITTLVQFSRANPVLADQICTINYELVCENGVFYKKAKASSVKTQVNAGCPARTLTSANFAVGVFASSIWRYNLTTGSAQPLQGSRSPDHVA